MGQVHACDGCKRISESGQENWFYFEWRPMSIRGGSSIDGPSDEIPYAGGGYSAKGKLVCSAECFIALLRFAFEDMKQWTDSVLYGIQELERVSDKVDASGSGR